MVLVSGSGGRSFLTNLENSEVLKILKWHPDDDKVYFVATMPGEPGAQHMFRVAADPQKADKPECMTCKHTDMKDGHA